MATSTQEKLSPSEVAQAVKRTGGFIGLSAAARLIGVAPSNFKRDLEERFTRIPVEGTGVVFFTSEIKAFAKERKQRARSNGRR